MDKNAAMQSRQNAERSKRRSSGTGCFTLDSGKSVYHSCGSEAPRAMAPRLICIEVNKRSVEGTRAHAVRSSVHIDSLSQLLRNEACLPHKKDGHTRQGHPRGFSAVRSNIPLQRARRGRSRVGLPAQRDGRCGTSARKKHDSFSV